MLHENRLCSLEVLPALTSKAMILESMPSECAASKACFVNDIMTICWALCIASKYGLIFSLLLTS